MLNGTRLTLDAQHAGIAVLRFHNPPHGFMDDVTERELGAALKVNQATDRQFLRHLDRDRHGFAVDYGLVDRPRGFFVSLRQAQEQVAARAHATRSRQVRKGTERMAEPAARDFGRKP